jgi:Tol biopolymer transport system component
MTPKIYPLIATLLTLAALAGCGGPPLAQPEATPRSPVATPSAEAADVAVAQATATQVPPTAPPTPALSPLDESLQTIIFTTSGEQGPEIWRVQVDEAGQKAGPVERVPFPSNHHTSVYDLFPSPDGQKVAIYWSYGDGAAVFIHILDVVSGKITPLFGENAVTHPAVNFLAWTPDSQNVLVIGIRTNPDLRNSGWLVDVDAHTYHDVNIKQVNGRPYIIAASFSPDGKEIVYVQSDCSQCGSQIWRTSINTANQQLMFEVPSAVVDVSWSPNGDYIAFIQRKLGAWEWDKYIMGELYITKPDNSEKYLLSSIVTHFFNHPFRPTWSPDGHQIAFVSSEVSRTEGQLDELSSNIYIADVTNKQIQQLTKFENDEIVRPTWSPDGSQVAFLNKSKNSLLKTQVTATNNHSINHSNTIQNLLETQFELNQLSSVVWLPQ